MFTADTCAYVSIVFRDREGNEASTRLSFPFALSDALISTYMGIWIGNVLPLTNAGISSYTITRAYEDDAFERPTEGTQTLDRLVLFYSNGLILDRIIVPSANMDLMELLGPYAGIRVDAGRADVATLITGMQDVVTFVVTPEADPFPTIFVVGGLML